MNEQQILQIISQLEASIGKIEAFLDTEDFKEYCDNIYSNIAMWKVILKNLNDKIMDKNGIILEVQKGIDDTPDNIRGQYSDGYHTFDELYEIRKAYNVALFNEWGQENPFELQQREYHNDIHKQKVEFTPRYNVHKSKKHYDGEECFGGGWFIVVAILPTGQISNHYKLGDWDLFKIPETEKALFEFDGHTTKEVIERLTHI